MLMLYLVVQWACRGHWLDVECSRGRIWLSMQPLPFCNIKSVLLIKNVLIAVRLFIYVMFRLFIYVRFRPFIYVRFCPIFLLFPRRFALLEYCLRSGSLQYNVVSAAVRLSTILFPQRSAPFYYHIVLLHNCFHSGSFI